MIKKDLVCGVAAILLMILLVLAIANRIYIERTTGALIEMLDGIENLSDTTEDDITKIIEYWDNSSAIIDLTSTQKETSNIKELFDKLKLSARFGDEYEYKTAMAQLKRAIADIGKREKISSENIF